MRSPVLCAVALILCACSKPQDIQVHFEARFNDRPLTCTSESPALNDLRFFVSGFYAITGDGRRVALALSNDGQYQSGVAALIDLESGEGHCMNGTDALNSTVALEVPAGTEFYELEFTLGVPFASNHQNPLEAEAPLDDSAMHWHWRSGYKFMRAGLATGRNLAWLHLGSTGCEGETRSIQSCKEPNRVTVTLPYQAALTHGIAVHLEKLFGGVDLAADQPFDCSSGPLEDSCTRVFPALGLGTDAPQTVFLVVQQ